MLGGGAVSQAVRSFLRAAEGTTLDAFPSGHAAISMLAAHVGTRLFPGPPRFCGPGRRPSPSPPSTCGRTTPSTSLAGALLYLLTLPAVPWAARLLGGEDRG